jgi:hypothetical protein
MTKTKMNGKVLLAAVFGLMAVLAVYVQSVQKIAKTGESNMAQSTSVANSSQELAKDWQVNNHVHGLAINPNNPNILYIATHNGLIQRSETGQWLWMQPEKERADYMGFTADPTSPHRFYASGHPHTGGNLGFQVTEDQAKSWKQLSMPGVDFHALAIAPNNPAIFYGYPASGAEGLHLSIDGGKSWKSLRMEGLEDHPFNLVVDPQNADHVYAIAQSGLYESRDRGERWILSPNTQDAPVIGLALRTESNKTIMYGYRASQSAPGIYRSLDEGKTWEKWGSGTSGLILYLAIAPSNSQFFYAVNQNNAVFQSQDGGKTWSELS